jgi:hypothetical protein
MKYPHGTKSEWYEQALQIVKGNIAISDEDVPDLLAWLQDYNWPGAREIADYLVILGEKVVPQLRTVFESNDAIWISTVLLAIVDRLPPQLCREIQSDLNQIASREDDEGAHLAALRILIEKRLITRTEATKLLEQKEVRRQGADDDLQIVRECASKMFKSG